MDFGLAPRHHRLGQHGQAKQPVLLPRTSHELESHGKACGCAGLEKAPENICYLERLAVLPRKRRRGYGGQLVKKVVQDARQLGFTTISIGIIAKQVELVDWYRKRGFALGESKQFPHLPFTVAFMSLKLPPG